MATLRSLVFVESPYSGDIDRHVRYLMLCGYDCWVRGELGVNSHGTMTQHPAKPDFFVSDYDSQWDVFTRGGAIAGAHALRHACSKVVFYNDLGWSRGMKDSLAYCEAHSIPFEVRTVNVTDILSLHAPLVTKQLLILDRPTNHILYLLGYKQYL